ncbi:hypothetical protein ZWY2020_009259, partial [Hordeum vulgare]
MAMTSVEVVTETTTVDTMAVWSQRWRRWPGPWSLSVATEYARDYIGPGPPAPAPFCSWCSSSSASGETGSHLALRLVLPGCGSVEEAGIDAALTLGPAPASTRGGAKRGFTDSLLDRTAGVDWEEDKKEGESAAAGAGAPPAAKAQVVGWPPVRSYRKNTLAANATKTKAENQGRSEAGCCYVKVSMDEAPYLRKLDLKTYSSYDNISLELEKMFSCFITAYYVKPTPTRGHVNYVSAEEAAEDPDVILGTLLVNHHPAY